ncbi:MAG: diacylglycerol kinase family protein [Flaviaesturariibacter sp.]|nr:diacylglycerol kinase family protein [Flaviaesturariibacter sp.]
MRYFIRSVFFALRGIYNFFRTERNGKIQGLIAVLAIAAGIFFELQKIEWLFLFLCIAVVISLEMLNSAIERVCNMYTTEFHPAIKIIKDVAAAAVLWSSIMAAIIGGILFLPHISALLGARISFRNQ